MGDCVLNFTIGDLLEVVGCCVGGFVSSSFFLFCDLSDLAAANAAIRLSNNNIAGPFMIMHQQPLFGVNLIERSD